MSMASPALGLVGNVELSLTLQRRLVIGGVGALTPVLLSLAVVDLRTTLQSADTIAIVGYLARVVALFCIGALTAWLHKQELDERKLFQLGMVGPALLTTMLNGSQINPAPGSSAPVERRAAVSSFFVAPLYAQQQGRPVYSFDEEPPRPSAMKRFLRGFVGLAHHGPYFVALQEEGFQDADRAFRRADQVRRLDGDFENARVFRSPVPGGGYVVALGSWVDHDDAIEIEEEAREEKLQTIVFTRLTATAALSAPQRPAPRPSAQQRAVRSR